MKASFLCIATACKFSASTGSLWRLPKWFHRFFFPPALVNSQGPSQVAQVPIDRRFLSEWSSVQVRSALSLCYFTFFFRSEIMKKTLDIISGFPVKNVKLNCPSLAPEAQSGSLQHYCASVRVCVCVCVCSLHKCMSFKQQFERMLHVTSRPRPESRRLVRSCLVVVAHSLQLVSIVRARISRSDQLGCGRPLCAGSFESKLVLKCWACIVSMQA